MQKRTVELYTARDIADFEDIANADLVLLEVITRKNTTGAELTVDGGNMIQALSDSICKNNEKTYIDIKSEIQCMYE